MCIRDSVTIETTPGGELRLIDTTGSVVAGPLGQSPAIVLAVDAVADGVTISARSADTLDRIEITHVFNGAVSVEAVLTVGGPWAGSGIARGRRRSGSLLVDLRKKPQPIDGVARAVGTARSLAGRVKRRVT